MWNSSSLPRFSITISRLSCSPSAPKKSLYSETREHTKSFTARRTTLSRLLMHVSWPRSQRICKTRLPAAGESLTWPSTTRDQCGKKEKVIYSHFAFILHIDCIEEKNHLYTSLFFPQTYTPTLSVLYDRLPLQHLYTLLPHLKNKLLPCSKKLVSSQPLPSTATFTGPF